MAYGVEYKNQLYKFYLDGTKEDDFNEPELAEKTLFIIDFLEGGAFFNRTDAPLVFSNFISKEGLLVNEDNIKLNVNMLGSDFKKLLESGMNNNSMGKQINSDPDETYRILPNNKKMEIVANFLLWDLVENKDFSTPSFKSIYESSIIAKPSSGFPKKQVSKFERGKEAITGFVKNSFAGLVSVFVNIKTSIRAIESVTKYWTTPKTFRQLINETFFGGDTLLTAGAIADFYESDTVGQRIYGRDWILNIYEPLPNKAATTGRVTRDKNEIDFEEIIGQKRKQQEEIATLSEDEVGDLFSSESTDSLQWSIEQCILLTSLKTFADKRKEVRKTSLSDGLIDYGGRVIPVHCKPPQAFVNFLNCPPYSYHYTKEITTEIQQDIEYDFEIAKVKEKGGQLREYPFNFGRSDDEDGYADPKVTKIKLDYANPDKAGASLTGSAISQAISISPENLNTSISFSKVSIDFKGENFATAKTNVDVTLEIEVLSLLLLQAEFKDKLPGPDGHDYTYSLVELFTYLNKSNVANGTGASRIFKTAYSPDYNRLIMKIIPKIVKGRSISDKRIETFINKSQLILDLALVDYTIKKDEVLQKATITINYKGFIRSYLNEPLADCITSTKIIDERIKAEKDLIEELETGFCDYRAANKKIADYFKDIGQSNSGNNEDNKVRGRQRIIGGLLQRKKIYFFEYKPMTILSGNVDKKSKKLVNPSKVAQIIKQNSPLFSIENEETIDIDGEINLKGTERLSFFYLGDLIDVLMDFMYGENPTTPRRIEQTSRINNFPLKVILPTFYPNILTTGGDGEVSFVTATDDKDLVNLADIPVAVEWFKKWFEEEVIKKDLRHYPVGMFVNKLVNSLVNNVLNDDCYLMGNFERKYFSVKSDFGLFSLKNNSTNKDKNSTFFDRRFAKNGKQQSWARFTRGDIPIIEKDSTKDRLDNCNYLIVYEQMNAFTDYSNFGVDGDLEKAFGEFEVPTFRLRRLNSLNQPTSFVKSIGFSKVEQNYLREGRFQSENLNSLAQLASVHNAKITTLPFLNIYPGMLCWVDVGLQDAPNTYGSVAWLLGMGGYHIIKQVTHTANISGNRIVGSSFQTVIDAVYVNNGAGNQNTLCKKTKEVGIRDPETDNDGEEVLEQTVSYAPYLDMENPKTQITKETPLNDESNVTTSLAEPATNNQDEEVQQGDVNTESSVSEVNYFVDDMTRLSNPD